MASPLTIYSGAGDGQVSCYNNTYLTARSGGGTLGAETAAHFNNIGQRFASPTYYVWQLAFSFDTSGVGATSTVTVATVSLYANADQTTDGDHTVQIRAYNWGDTLTTADFVAGASLEDSTLVASKTTAGLATNAYTAFTSEAAALTNITQDGTTYWNGSSSDQVAATVPTNRSLVVWWMSDEEGTTYDPKLYIEYTEAAAGCPRQSMYLARMRNE